jgi:hypothetical protein
MARLMILFVHFLERLKRVKLNVGNEDVDINVIKQKRSKSLNLKRHL